MTQARKDYSRETTTHYALSAITSSFLRGTGRTFVEPNTEMTVVAESDDGWSTCADGTEIRSCFIDRLTDEKRAARDWLYDRCIVHGFAYTPCIVMEETPIR